MTDERHAFALRFRTLSDRFLAPHDVGLFEEAGRVVIAAYERGYLDHLELSELASLVERVRNQPPRAEAEKAGLLPAESYLFLEVAGYDRWPVFLHAEGLPEMETAGSEATNAEIEAYNKHLEARHESFLDERHRLDDEEKRLDDEEDRLRAEGCLLKREKRRLADERLSLEGKRKQLTEIQNVTIQDIEVTGDAVGGLVPRVLEHSPSLPRPLAGQNAFSRRASSAELHAFVCRLLADEVEGIPQPAGRPEPRVSADTGKGKIVVDNKEYEAPPHWCTAVQALVDEGGKNLTGPQLQGLHGCHGKKWSREFAKLKKKIPDLANRLISDGNKGYRIQNI